MVQFLLKRLLKQSFCCVPRFPLILTAKFHSLYVKESGVGVGNFGKVGVGNFGNSERSRESKSEIFGKSEWGVGVGYFTPDPANPAPQPGASRSFNPALPQASRNA